MRLNIRVMSLQAMRKRLPLWAFILLALICLVMLGIACACATDRMAPNVDRAVGAISAAPAIVEVWTLALGVLVMLVPLDARRRRAAAETSPAVLQCFLF